MEKELIRTLQSLADVRLITVSQVRRVLSCPWSLPSRKIVCVFERCRVNFSSCRLTIGDWLTGKVLRLKSKPVCNVLLSLKLFIIQHLEARCSTLKISSRATNSLEMSKKFSHRKISCLINTLTTTTTTTTREERKKKRDKPYRLVTLLLPSPHDVRFFVSLF